MRTLATKARAINQYNGLGNQLWDLAGNRPSLDLPFADNKSLVDATTGANLVDFTRASSGTYVDSEGVIRTAVTNLLLRSEEFETTWGTTNASIAANTATAPNGTVTADTLIEDSTTGGHVVVQSISGAPDNTSFTSSCYCKALQLEQSTTVGEYIPTTSTINSAPRFDHDPTTGESLGLLVEESRTNLLLRSEEFDDASWVKGASTTVTANYAVAPNGTTAADRVEMPNTIGTVVSQPATVVSGLTYTSGAPN
jgi:hypothetical protein